LDARGVVCEEGGGQGEEGGEEERRRERGKRGQREKGRES
jgi:hypothetical protein